MNLKLWQSEFGDEYAKRNQITEESLNARCVYFANVLNLIKNESKGDFPESVLEVGCGQGQNLMAIDRLLHQVDLKIKLGGCEPNEKARKLAANNCPVASVGTDALPHLSYDSSSYELVFTSGVLIHVPTSDLLASMREIYRVSSKYILCMEYFSPVERKVPYHGQDEALWLRDYGAIWIDNFKLKCVGYGFCWKRYTKIDDITWWLFEKVN